MVMLCDPTETEADRGVVAVLAANENMTVPVLVPAADEAKVSQLALLLAVHEHPLDVLMLIVPEAAPAAKEEADAVREYIHCELLPPPPETFKPVAVFSIAK
jgi:hypothetical protein